MGLTGTAAVITPGDEVELVPGQAVVIPLGHEEVVMEAEKGASFVRCVAPQLQ